jgi:tetratricopeptide (TPR) repeat protein
MNSRSKKARVSSLLVFVLSSTLAGRTQVSENAPASVSQIKEKLKQHPDSSKLYVALGLAYWEQNDYPHALQAFELAVKLSPASPEAHNWLGVATLEKGNLPAAIAEFRKATALDSKYARAYTNLGSALGKSGELAAAVDAFRRALSLEPDNLAAHMNLGLALRRNGDAKGALPHLRLVAERDANNANAQYVLGQNLQQSADLPGAIAAFESTVRINPAFREGYYALGLALKQQAASLRKTRRPPASVADDLYKRAQEAAAAGHLKEAEGLLGEALSKDDSNVDAQNLLGFILGQQGDLRAALIHLERAVALEPELADPHYNLGVALWYSGLKTKGVSELRAAVRLDPAAGAIYAFLGTALRETDQLEDARRNLQRAIALLPSLPATYVDLGIVYLRSGDLDRALGQLEAGLNASASSSPAPDWDAAIASIRTALVAKPDCAEAHNMLGLLLGRKGADSTTILAEFREGARLRPDFAEAHNNAGLVLAQGHQDQAAIAEFREALRIQPAYADAHANLGTALISTDSREAVRELEKAATLDSGLLKAQFNLAVAYGVDARYGPTKEIEQLRKVIATEPTLARARLALGKALLGDGKVEEAIGELREAVRLESQNTGAHYQLGLALARAGRKEEATTELQKSRELASSDDRKQNAELDIAEGRVALDKGDLDQAAAKFRHALELQPESSDAQHFLGAVLEKQGDAESASAAYRKAVQLNAGDLFARERVEAFSKGKVTAGSCGRIAEVEGYIRGGRFQEVELLLAAYVKDDPKASWCWYALGYTLFAQRRIGESIQALAKSLELDVQNAEAHKILGRDLMIIGRLDAAQKEFELGIQYNPRSAEMHFNLGKLFSIEDNWNGAQKEFETALRIDPSYVEALDALGFALEALGDDAGAVVSYEKAIVINEARKGKFVSAHVNLSAHYNRKVDSEKALAYARAALELDPKSDGAWFQQAKAREAQGRLDDAVDALKRAISLNPRASSYHYVLAQVYRRLGQAEESRKALDSFLHLEKETGDLEKMRRNLANHAVSPPQSRSQHD